MEGQVWKLSGSSSKWKQKGVQKWISLFLVVLNDDSSKLSVASVADHWLDYS